MPSAINNKPTFSFESDPSPFLSFKQSFPCSPARQHTSHTARAHARARSCAICNRSVPNRMACEGEGAALGGSFSRPAAAFSVLHNERGSSCEDTFVIIHDLLAGGGSVHGPAAAVGAGDGAEPAFPAEPGVRLFGVYDGHGGGAASKHCAQRLHHVVAARLRALLRSGGGAAALDSPNVAAALREAFVETDMELKASGMLDSNSGSTAVVALLTPSTVWLAWAGEAAAARASPASALAQTALRWRTPGAARLEGAAHAWHIAAPLPWQQRAMNSPTVLSTGHAHQPAACISTRCMHHTLAQVTRAPCWFATARRWPPPTTTSRRARTKR